MLNELTDELLSEVDASQADVEHNRPTQAEILINLASNLKLFHTADRNGYAGVVAGAHTETWALRSPDFRRWLTREYYIRMGKPCRPQAVTEAIALLEARAQFESPEATVHVRVAGRGGRIYVDLGDDQHRVVEIDEEGWRVIANSPVHFLRTRSIRALPEPQRGGDIESLRKVLNIGSDNNWLLCLAWMIAALRPTGPYPILILQGEQGSAKSTTAKLLRRLIDPSVSLVRTPPKHSHDLFIAASNSHVLAYDNLSGIPSFFSDALCMLSTGGGLSTRQLYTDSEEIFFEAMRPVILNGIDHLAERADLADRAVILNLPAIEESQRKDEAQLYADFDHDLPLILGGIYDVLSATIRNLPNTHLEAKPRMADFARVAAAAEGPLGFQKGAFEKAYYRNRANAIQETLEGDAIGSALLLLMATEDEWHGTNTELLKRLDPLLDEGTKKLRDTPKTARALSGKLRRLATFLRESGVHITFPSSEPHGRASKGQRILRITKIDPQTSAASAATATTATPDSAPVAVHGDSSAMLGGGRVGGVAIAQGDSGTPPPISVPSKLLDPLGINDEDSRVAVVAVEPSASTERCQQVNLCPNCGVVDWEWVDRAWRCPKCQTPARNQPGLLQTSTEHFEI